MSDYPNPDEEFELMYGDELELLQDQENYELVEPPVKKSLTSGGKTNVETTQLSQSVLNNSPSLFSTQNESQNNDSFPPAASINIVSEHISQESAAEHLTQNSLCNKRNIDELFGDIGDLDFEEFETQQNKKAKLSRDEEMHELMEHIILLRKLNKEKSNILSVNKSVSTNTADRDKYNLSYRVPKYPFIGVKRHDGERVYVRFHSEDFEKEEVLKVVKESIGSDILGERKLEIWNEAKALITKQTDDQLNQNDCQDISLMERSEDHKQLWADLYRPKKYIELLSDESTNRIMLKWLKLWDKVVFNRRPRVKIIKPVNNKFQFKKLELITDLDEYGRPYHKIALLCGPPGLGKTTLAHVAAKHAGYNVVEVNASDDRSVQAFKTSLENATQMKSLVDQEGRPNCLVFDEIDGAPQASIDYLIKFVGGKATNKSKKGKKEFILKRPIICICNDVYVPALRPLRQIAFVVNFPQTSSARLAERLMSICRREQIKTDLYAMIALAEKSNNDIRSCLSVLHFIKAQKNVVTLSDIYRANIGQKDMQKGLFSVWQEIFKIQQPKQKNVIDKNAMKARMSKILQTISSFGDYDRVIQGVYENFPKLHLKDSSLEGLSKALEWFTFSDVLNKQITTLQNYSLYPYMPYPFVVWHFVFAVSQSQKLNYPSVGYEMKQKEIRRKGIVTELLKGMQPSVRAYSNRLSLTLDSASPLIRIIVPNFRPVSLHLYTKEEKDAMLRVVNIMIDYNLIYIQERLPDGTYVFNLEPNIEELIPTDLHTFSKRETLSYSNKQLISKEIELEKMRRFEGPKNDEKQKTVGDKQDKQLPNHLQRLAAKVVKSAKPSVAKDFFGRVITKPTPIAKDGPELNNDIWYQYKEGYNNAVRKRMRLKDLL